MAGHSKWANIKHKKAAVDAKRGKVFSKIAREITVCARVGGGDPGANITLRALIQKARSVNMPADNIDRAVKKGTGELGEDLQLEELTYEGFGPGGVGVIVEVLTDNKNRSASEVRQVFTKAGTSLAAQGAVSHAFKRKGLITVAAEGNEEDALMELALEAGAEDFEQDGDAFSITTEPGDFMAVMEALNQAGIVTQSSELTMLPDNYLKLEKASQAGSVLRFLENLEDLDDVQNVFNNLEIDETVLAALESE